MLSTSPLECRLQLGVLGGRGVVLELLLLVQPEQRRRVVVHAPELLIELEDASLLCARGGAPCTDLAATVELGRVDPEHGVVETALRLAESKREHVLALGRQLTPEHLASPPLDEPIELLGERPHALVAALPLRLHLALVELKLGALLDDLLEEPLEVAQLAELPREHVRHHVVVLDQVVLEGSTGHQHASRGREVGEHLCEGALVILDPMGLVHHEHVGPWVEQQPPHRRFGLLGGVGGGGVVGGGAALGRPALRALVGGAQQLEEAVVAHDEDTAALLPLLELSDRCAAREPPHLERRLHAIQPAGELGEPLRAHRLWDENERRRRRAR